MEPLTARGTLGTVIFDGVFVTISRTGWQAAGGGKGERRIPVRSLSSVMWKKPGPLMKGFIEFGIAGTPTDSGSAGSSLKSAQNQNAVFFSKKQMPAFSAIRDAVDLAIAEASV